MTRELCAWPPPPRCRKKSFGIENPAEIRGEEIGVDAGRGIRFTLWPAGRKMRVNLSVFGRHNVYNALAAASLGEHLRDGARMKSQRVWKRFSRFTAGGKPVLLPGGIHLLDDSYNSNPDSLKATLSAFAEMKGGSRGLAVLGDMLEIGPSSPEVPRTGGRAGRGDGVGPPLCLGRSGAAGSRKGRGRQGWMRKGFISPRDLEELLAILDGILTAGGLDFDQGITPHADGANRYRSQERLEKG